MNAYELADELNKFDKTSIVANMLRQQADRIQELSNWKINAIQRIAELEKEKIRAYDNGYEDGWKSLTTNSKPVAWMYKLCFHPTKMDVSLDKPSEEHYPNAIPLYTNTQLHPESQK